MVVFFAPSWFPIYVDEPRMGTYLLKTAKKNSVRLFFAQGTSYKLAPVWDAVKMVKRGDKKKDIAVFYGIHVNTVRDWCAEARLLDSLVLILPFTFYVLFI